MAPHTQVNSFFLLQGASGRNLNSPKGGRKGKTEVAGGGGGRGQTRSPRQAPEGEEGSGKGGGLVRQGTFNVDEEGVEEEVEGPVALNATLDGHLTRTKAVRQLK